MLCATRAIAASAAALSLCVQGCRSVEKLPEPKRVVTAAAFSQPGETPNPAPPPVEEAATANNAAAAGPALDASDGGSASLRVGRRWIVDALIGQINGRPLYAGEFLESLEDRILRLAAEEPDERARLATAELVSNRLQQYVNNELIIAEAEQQLSPEMRAGLISFLQQIRESTISGYGGTRQGAEASLAETYGMSLDEFVNEKKNEALARELLRKRIQPRVIVSWRDVELAFARLQAQEDATGKIAIGRIRMPVDDPRVPDITRRLAGGEDFEAIATELSISDNGMWNEFDLPDDGIAGLELAEDIRGGLQAVPQGKASAPVTRGTSMHWYCVLDVRQPNGKSIWDPAVQLSLRSDLENSRAMREQNRYLFTLRDKWISSDFDDMRRRLVAIAIQRYFPE